MKNFLKNNLKTILTIGVTAIICISGTAFAADILAKNISYTRTGTNIKNVEEALNDLYNNTSSTTKLIKIGDIDTYTNGTEFDCTILNNYESLTENNFIIIFDSIFTNASYSDGTTQHYTKTYNQSTGKLKITRSSGWYVNGTLYYISNPLQ